MSAYHFFQLLLLASIWGASFLFTRISVSYVGPVFLTELRIALAALFLFFVAFLIKKPLAFKKHWRHFLVLGLFGSALPFLFISYAAYELNASLLSILNATAPIWGVLITNAYTKQALSKKMILGLILGITGVYLLVGVDLVALNIQTLLAISCSLLAAISYGITSTYAHLAPKMDSYHNAHGSMWMGTLLFIPLLPLFPPLLVPTLNVSLAIIGLGVLCTGFAYIIYFNLIAKVGAASALTVTYLVPLFGVLWGALFLKEKIGDTTILGAIIVLIGTALVTDFSFKSLFKPRS